MNAESSGRTCEHPALRPSARRSGGFLSALRRDTAGNALAIMAAFLFPLTALAGSAVDMSRAYLVKVRLQQACDAGVLAGRKLMTVNSGTALDDASTQPSKPAETQARAFFNNNFRPGWMSTTNVVFTPSRTSDGQVTATATATLPMVIMGMFGAQPLTQTVTCTARLDVGDSDIMFVLDTTGSMACVTGSGCSTITTYTREDGTTGYYRVEMSGSKIAALRDAVETFHTTLAANAPATANIRYGFVPYASAVNVGKIIKDTDPAYLVDEWTYQSRELATDLSSKPEPSAKNAINYDVTDKNSPGEYYHGDVLYGSTPSAVYVPLSGSNNNKAGCLAQETRMSGSTPYARGTWPASGTLVRKFPYWNGNCYTYSWNVKPLWRYQPVTYDVSGYKNSLGPSGVAVDDPSKITSATSKWTGCIEERETRPAAAFNQNSLPADLDPDLVPNSDETRWRPMWPEVVYYRRRIQTETNSGSSTSPYGDTTNARAGDDYTSPAQSFNARANLYACGKAAQRLRTMSLADVRNYLAPSGDFRALGYTYHDYGMIWGVRLLSPTGIWKNDTAAWPGNNPPNRYIVFMSDGLLQTHTSSYGMYGVEELDRRVTAAALGQDAVKHNVRFQAACAAAKARNITVFVVAFDTVLSSEMEGCASPGFAYTASDSAGLNAAFANMALQVAKLRLSQ